MESLTALFRRTAIETPRAAQSRMQPCVPFCHSEGVLCLRPCLPAVASFRILFACSHAGAGAILDPAVRLCRLESRVGAIRLLSGSGLLLLQFGFT